PIWRAVQRLAAPGESVGKFDVAARGGAFVALYEAGEQIFTRVLFGRDRTLSQARRLTADDLVQRSPVLVSSGDSVYLAYVAPATPMMLVGALRLFRSSDGLDWQRLPGLNLRDKIPFRVRVAISGRRLLALIAAEVDKLMLCSFPLQDGP
ncbi:MAG: hypothetical protein HY303_07385, partial [Candidatus Wallbacteria bacterium]|nr:hypothetical protein [Candidatus Wallbacteria bacterium]